MEAQTSELTVNHLNRILRQVEQNLKDQFARFRETDGFKNRDLIKIAADLVKVHGYQDKMVEIIEFINEPGMTLPLVINEKKGD